MSKRKWVNPSGTKTYYAWRSMRFRCKSTDPRTRRNYLDRGITYCERWENYDSFYEDMGPCPGGLTLERVDNDQGYEKSNCRWATVVDQLNNQRRNRRIFFNGVTQTLSQWGATLRISPDTLLKRLERMPPEDALRPGKLSDYWQHGTRKGYERRCRCDDCKGAHNLRMRAQRARKKHANRLRG